MGLEAPAQVAGRQGAVQLLRQLDGLGRCAPFRALQHGTLDARIATAVRAVAVEGKNQLYVFQTPLVQLLMLTNIE